MYRMSLTLSPNTPVRKLASRKTLAVYKAALAEHSLSHPFWRTRTCFQEPPESEVWTAANDLQKAVDALLVGDHDTATKYIRSAERPKLLAWGVPIMSVVKPEIIRWRPIDETKLPPSGRVDTGRFTPSLLDAMYRRDGWRCRFCGCPVVRPAARNRLGRLLPGAFRWTTCYGDHAGFFVLSGVADHVQPHSWSGPTNLDNLVTCCQPCNYGRGSAFLSEVGLVDPRRRDPYPADGWDGLERVLILREPLRSQEMVSVPVTNTAVWFEFAALVKTHIGPLA